MKADKLNKFSAHLFLCSSNDTSSVSEYLIRHENLVHTDRWMYSFIDEVFYYRFVNRFSIGISRLITAIKALNLSRENAVRKFISN